MRQSGKIASSALKKALEKIKVGVTELEVDKTAEEEIYRLGGDLSYKSVPGYKYATCITVNDQVVHGIPTDRKFVLGDLVSVDLAIEYKGWHTDCAWSILLGEDKEKRLFLEAGEKALWEALAQAVDGKTVGDISHAIQTTVEQAGYSVVRSLVGHGIGRKLHEDPEIPGFGEKGSGPILRAGQTLAIEVIYAQNKSELELSGDGWTFSTVDKSWGGLFEMSVIVGQEKAEILTPLWVVK